MNGNNVQYYNITTLSSRRSQGPIYISSNIINHGFGNFSYGIGVLIVTFTLDDIRPVSTIDMR